MVWSELENDSNSYQEADKIAAHIVQYTRGRVLDLGSGPKKCWPHFINVDSCKDFNGQKIGNIDIVSDCKNLKLFGDESWDSIFSSHLLEHFDKKEVGTILKEWARILRPNGYLVLYLPSANLYPKVGKPGANKDHKWDIYPGDIEKILQEDTDCGWTQIEKEERQQRDEYSLFLVFKKRKDGKFVEKIWERNPEGKKRCLIIRYGAIGDQIQTSSVFPQIKAQGYHITYNTSAPADQVLMNDPHIDEWLIQDKDQVPNPELGPYWLQLEERYDKIVNFCESIEGGLLQMPGRLQHKYCEAARRKIFGTVNYIERMHDIAGVPFFPAPKFYPTTDEIEVAKKEYDSCKAPVIVWCLTGTSFHKTYPFVNTVVKWIIENTPAHIYLFGDKYIAKIMQDGILECLKEDKTDLSRVHPVCGLWDLRLSLTFACMADIAIGPETGIMNAVAMEPDVRKIIYLSHSSDTNLTRDWLNTKVLVPKNTTCYPCHMLHYGWETCNKIEKTQAAQCASDIPPEDIFKEVMDELIRASNKIKEAS